MKSKINRLKHTYNTQWYNIITCNIKCIEKLSFIDVNFITEKALGVKFVY